MEIDWELEQWLLDTGEKVTLKLMAEGPASLSLIERFLREVWILDIQTSNGGVSQFFCNYGLSHWNALKESWPSRDVPGLGPIIIEIDRVIAGAEDPYLATLDASPGIEDVYDVHSSRMKAELRDLWRKLMLMDEV
jgi:hypothetical protein